MIWLLFLSSLFAADYLTMDAKVAERARAAGAIVEGEVVFRITGHVPDKSALLIDSVIQKSSPATQKLRADSFYIARDEFGLDRFWRQHPKSDGRGVIVGVIDDGVSPTVSGLQKTSTGKRKVLRRHWTSKALDTKLSTRLNAYARTSTAQGEILSGSINEKTLKQLVDKKHEDITDLNVDGRWSLISVAYFPGRKRVCVDTDVDKKIDRSECFRLYSVSGQYGFWDKDETYSIEAEYVSAKKTLRLSWGERNGSHGEGVASVMAGYQIGGQFDGIAPGAQLVDWDFSDPDTTPRIYTIGRFVEALEWMGKQKVEVVNISYSLYFASVEAQEFMQEALSKLVEKYNFVISFSAGNTGPGLGSLNRQLIYPPNSMVVGAYVSPKLDELVWGTRSTQGRVVYYSNRGPNPKHGMGPTLIAPLSAVTASVPDVGFRAFSGTSSAAPAAAGLATVLISHLKSLGLKVDAETVVHALRQSAKPISGAGFVEQGAGLPNMARAIAVYKELVDGKRLARFETSIGTQEDQGVFLSLSDVASDREYQIKVSGVFSPLVPLSQQNQRVFTLQLKYSDSALSGPRALWLGRGTASMSVNVKKSSLNMDDELMAHIEVVDDRQKLIGQIPFTVVRDHEVDGNHLWTGRLKPQQGLRRHLRLDGSMIGVRVRLDADSAQGRVLSYFYDSSQVRLKPEELTYRRSHYVVPVPHPGTYQTAVVRVKGSSRSVPFEQSVTPIDIRLASQVVSDEIQLANYNQDEEFELHLESARKFLWQKVLTQERGAFVYEFKPRKSGEYSWTFEPTYRAAMTSPSNSCASRIGDTDFERNRSLSLKVKGADVGKLVQIRCLPFSSNDSSDEIETLEDKYVLRLYRGPLETQESRSTVKVLKGQHSYDLINEGLSEGMYRVQLKPLLGSGSLDLGTVEYSKD